MLIFSGALPNPEHRRKFSKDIKDNKAECRVIILEAIWWWLWAVYVKLICRNNGS